MVYSTDCLLVGQFAEHKGTPARLLHHFGPIVARNFAKRLVAIHNWIVDYLCVRQQETTVRCNKRENHILQKKKQIAKMYAGHNITHDAGGC